MKRGYIKLWRKIWSHKYFQEKRKFSRFEAWIDMDMLANGKDKEIIFKGKPLLIKRGQFLTSQRRLADRWGWSKTKTRDFLKLSQNHDHSIDVDSDNKKTIITLLNYDKYNPLPEEKTTTENKEKKTTERPLKDHRLDTTNKEEIMNNKDNINTIIKQWNSKNIKNIEDRETKTKEKTIAKINTSLKDYSITEIIEAIDNYHSILEGDDYYFSYSWQLWEFLNRGLVNFLTKNNPFQNYLKAKENKPQNYVGNQCRQPYDEQDERVLKFKKKYQKKFKEFMKEKGYKTEDNIPFNEMPESESEYIRKKLEEIKKQERP